MNRKYLISFIAGLSFVALVGATFKSLMLDESGNCGQSVNFTGTTTLNSAAIATQAYSDGLVSTHNADGSAHSSAFAAKLTASNNLSDVSSASTARTNLQLGTAATQNVGTSAGNVVRLDGSAKLPAVDGSALTNLPASGESNTASNVGTGTGIFAQKSGVDLQFKSLIAGTNIEITYDSTGITIAATGSAAGETNTASNIGAGGVGVFAQKSGVDLQFKNIIAGSNKVLVSDDTADSEIAIDVQPGNIAHQDLSGAGTNTHTQIDNHISSTSNPHSVTASQVGALSTAGAAEINGLTEKTTPAGNDEIVIEDSEASYAKKKVKISNLPSGTGGSVSNTAWTGENLTGTDVAPSQDVVQNALINVGLRYADRVSASVPTDHGKLSFRNFSDNGIDAYTMFITHADAFPFVDSSTNAYTITNAGATQNTTTKKFGAGSINIDGSSSAQHIYTSLTGATFGTASPFTIEIPIYFSSIGSSYKDLLLNKTSDLAGRIMLMVDSSGYLVYNFYGQSSITSSSTVSTGSWHHVAIVGDATNLKLYLDGISVASAARSASNVGSQDWSTLCIGQTLNTSNVTYLIDEVRVSNVARWSTNFTPPTSAYSTSVVDNRLSDLKISDINHAMCQGRLTLESGVPVSTTDQTAKTTLYFTPNVTGENCGNKITVYDGTKWVLYSFSELSLSISSLTASTNYDIFVYDNAGTLTLSATAWTDAATRATALYNQDGVYVKTGATNYRYLGTIRITGTTGQCEDSVSKRFVWNMYNRTERRLKRFETSASWPYSTDAWQQANASALNQVECVCGVAIDQLCLKVMAQMTSSGTNQAGSASIGIGIDSTSVSSAEDLGGRGASSFGNLFGFAVEYEDTMKLGYHYYVWLERGWGSDTQTWYGYSSGKWQAGMLGNSLF